MCSVTVRRSPGWSPGVGGAGFSWSHCRRVPPGPSSPQGRPAVLGLRGHRSHLCSTATWAAPSRVCLCISSSRNTSHSELKDPAPVGLHPNYIYFQRRSHSEVNLGRHYPSRYNSKCSISVSSKSVALLPHQGAGRVEGWGLPCSQGLLQLVPCGLSCVYPADLLSGWGPEVLILNRLLRKFLSSEEFEKHSEMLLIGRNPVDV